MLPPRPTREKAYALPASTRFAEHPLLLLSWRALTLPAAGTEDASEGWRALPEHLLPQREGSGIVLTV